MSDGRISRRTALQALTAASLSTGWFLGGRPKAQAAVDPKIRSAVERGLDWVAKTQNRVGRWDAQGQYRVPMTALAGIALLAEGSTTTQGRYAEQLRRATDYLMAQTKSNGLIGELNDHRYTYGHGFSMLFLSQVLGEEEDMQRRKRLTEVLVKAVDFCVKAQTNAGGWGYVSAKDGGGFDEGSTTVTQVQGLRGCRNAGIPVPREAIEKAIKYIHNCTMPDGGICYSSQSRGASRPPITAAAVACLFNAGEYKGEYVNKLLDYCKRTIHDIENPRDVFGHWHYTYYYYSQAMYRLPGEWNSFRDKLYPRLLREQNSDGYWTGDIGPIYVTALNLTMLQLDKGLLPIYQR